VDNRFGLELQGLPSARRRVLVLADLVASRSSDGRFTASTVRQAFLDLNVPPPNVSARLTELKNAGHALPHRDGTWALTPIGAQEARRVGLSSTPNSSAGAPAVAEFAHTDHTVIPAWAAPPRWQAGISRLLNRHPFDTNVFCMTRFPSEGGLPDPVADAIACAKAELAKSGLTLHLASDSIVDDDLLGNVGAYMWACRYGLGIAEDRLGRGLNHNVFIELGGMTLLGRRCAILKDRSAPALPTDLSGQIYKSVDLDDLDGLATVVGQWAVNDLGAG